MTNRTDLPFLAGLAVVVLAAACDSPPEIRTPTSPRPLERVSLQVSNARADVAAERAGLGGQRLDSLFSEVDLAAPGFGGLYADVDAGGRLTVRLAPTGDENRVVAAVRRVFAGSQGIDGPIVIAPARFSFRQLRSWRDALHQALTFPYISSDLDEHTNAISIGVSSAAEQATVQSVASAIGIPAGAVRTFLTARPVATSKTLDSLFRPIRAGTLMTLTSSTGGNSCTVGPIVTYNGAPYILTASHCTEANGLMGGVNGTTYHQPVAFAANYVGVETVDPAFSPSLPGCFANLNEICRNSDAALIKIQNSDGSIPSVTRGLMAKTSYYATGDAPTPTNPYPGAGSRTVVDSVRFTQEDSLATAYYGAGVHKMGRTTGWTWGTTTKSCSKVQAPGQPLDFSTGVARTRYLICQNEVATTVEQGDSGGPVFIVWSENMGGVRAYGLAGVVSAQAFSDTDGHLRMWYSPMYSIRREVGSTMLTF